MTAAHNAKVLTTGIAIASTLGISTAYTINANAKILEKIEAAQTSVLIDPALVASTPAVAPSVPGPATPVSAKNNNKVKKTTPEAAVAVPVAVGGSTDSTGVPANTQPAVIAPVQPVIPPTTAPPTSSSK